MSRYWDAARPRRARYPGMCPRCHNDINPGDPIGFHNGETLHLKCVSGQDEE